MNRPEVRQVEGQRVEAEREITGYEAEELLRKYGYSQEQSFSTRVEPVQDQPPLTFEDMIAQQNEQRRREEEKRYQQMNGPKPITFGSNEYDSEVKYGSDDESGFGFKIEITTDMKIPKY